MDFLLLSYLFFYRGMFDKEKISKMKKGVLIVNNARGAIMDAQAISDACATGHVGGNIFKIYTIFRYLIPHCVLQSNQPLINYRV